MFKRIFGIVLLLIGPVALASAPVANTSKELTPKIQKWIVDLDQGGGDTQFLAKGRPSALKIVGKGSAPKGQLVLEGSKLSGVAHFPLETLDTGISLRNEHMKKKYLETEKFPEAKLTLASVELPGAREGDFLVQGVPFRGMLFLHGVEKEVAGTATVERKGNSLSFDAKFGLKVDDFSISSPSFAGVTMANEVEVGVKSQAPLTGQKL